MKKEMILGAIALYLVLVSYQANAQYNITHSNINYGTSYNQSSNYIIDWSLVEQPVRSALSATYATSLGFYHKYEDLEFVDLLGRGVYPVLMLAMMIFVATNQQRKENEEKEM